MAKKTVRILRTLPIEGIIYRANDLVSIDDGLLKTIDPKAWDDHKSAIAYCKSIGIEAVAHPLEEPAAPEGTDNSADENAGELAE